MQDLGIGSLLAVQIYQERERECETEENGSLAGCQMTSPVT